jgi:hypothetical protein
MKKLLLIASLFLCTMAFGQSKDTTKYAELVCFPRAFSQKFDITFVTSSLDSPHPMVSYSYPLDALNAYAKLGWHLVSTYSLPVGEGSYRLHLVIERN